jgi:hypothetical protein
VSVTDSGLGRARATIDHLAGAIGSRPVGSDAADRARAFVADALAGNGFTVRTQLATAVNEAAGTSARVANVIAVRDGSDRDAIALVSHYDSVPDGPGAQDDALGVATCLEAARQLSAAGLRHTLFVIVTDGEEVGLMGARAVRQDAEVAARVKTVLNFDGTGGTGPPVLFEAGPGRGDALEAWARSAPAPFGTSLGLEIYKRLPNDTDFTIFKNAGVSGLNLAPVGNSYVYHTDRDRPSGVSDDTIAREIVNTVATVRALDATSLAHTDDKATFFDIASRRGVVYGAMATWTIGAVAVALGLVAWILIARQALKAGGTWALLTSVVRATLTTAAAIGAMVGVAFGLRFLRHEPAPWYASPEWAFAAFAGAGLLVVWLAGRLRGKKSSSGKKSVRPLLVWWTSLPVWIALTGALLALAPAASYMVALPLAVIAAGGAASRRPLWIRGVSLVACAVAAVLWVPDIVVLLGFLVPLFGWLPVAAPVWIYPAVIGLVGLMLLPPWIAVWADSAIGRRATLLSGAACGLVFVAGAIGAFVVRPYTDDRPARRFVRYVQDDVKHAAWWDVGGSDSFTVPTGAWTETHSSIPATIPLQPLPASRDIRSSVAPVASTSPAVVRATTLIGPDGRLTLNVRIDRQQIITARIVLPAGITPHSSTWAGVNDHGRWTATTLGLAPGSDVVQMTFDGVDATALRAAIVLIQTVGVPADAPGRSLPTWLPGGPATWQARSLFILPAAPGES